jgi:hypothetical protein
MFSHATTSHAARIAIALWVLLAASASGPLADPAPDRPQNTAEIQLGGGVAFATASEFHPLAQVHARYSFWRTIGLGAYVAGIWVHGDSPTETIVPLCGRLNLSLPFWRTFEPMASLGLGTYWASVEYSDGTHSSGFHPGGHFAIALLFMGEKRGYGIEGVLHVREDELYGEAEAMGTVAASVVFR